MNQISNFWKYSFLFFTISVVFISCNNSKQESEPTDILSGFGESDCEKIQEWKIDNYTVVKKKCIDFAGPHYETYDIYKEGKFVDEGSKDECNSCIILQRIDDLEYVVFNICESLRRELTPTKNLLEFDSIVSIKMRQNREFTIQSKEDYSKDTVWTENYDTTNYKSMTPDQIAEFVKIWNESEAFHRSGKTEKSNYLFVIEFTNGSFTRIVSSRQILSLETCGWEYLNESISIDHFDQIWVE